MDNDNEIVESQHGSALNVGGGVAPEYLKELKTDVSLVKDIARQYCALTISDLKSRIYFVCLFVRRIRCVNKLLPIYLDELREGRCMGAFCISSGMYRDDMFWEWCNMIYNDMKGQNVYHHLKDSLETLKALLGEAEGVLIHSDPVLFEKFYYSEKERYSDMAVNVRFESWLYDNGYPDIDKLRELQAQVVAETLKMGVMKFDKVPSQKEIDEVNLDYLKRWLPYDFEMSEDFRVACAQWRRFMHWEGYILIINYKKYGKYIQAHFYDFNDEQLKAIFELDMMLQLINNKLAQLSAETEPETVNKEQKEELFKFIHPSICGDDELKIHQEVKRLVTHQKVPEICAYLKYLKQKGKVLLPSSPVGMYEELVRLGMPNGDGFTEKHFRNYYMK